MQIVFFLRLTDYLEIQIAFAKLFGIVNSKKQYLVYLYLTNSRNNCVETRKPARDVSLQHVIITKFSVSAIDLLLITI